MSRAKSNEHPIQNEIRNDLAGVAMVFRANVGTAWAGKMSKLSPTRIVLDNYRPFSTGLPPGFSDLFGAVEVVITPEMVGQSVAVFLAMEVKDKADPSEEQSSFIAAIKRIGGRAGVVRSVEDARRVVGGENA